MEKINNFLDKKISKKLSKAIFVIDKEAGKTSHDEVFSLRKTISKTIGEKIKVGHSGTLDPKVTGILVCGTGSATKSLEYILLSKKIYISEFLFHEKISKQKFEKSLEKFRGIISQTPPVRSAVKRVKRKREIYKINIIKFFEDGRSAKVLCAVEKGTYIRKLAHDIGIDMKVKTSMGDLRRIQAGVFSLSNSKVYSTEYIKEIFIKFNKNKFFIKKIWWFFKITKTFYSVEELFIRLNKEKKNKDFVY